jgi:ribosomal protein S18 acetylase RimI-like enzyme
MKTSRPPPSKIRVTKLQETQLGAVETIERSVSGRRTLAQIVALTKLHNVRVAEADDKVAGWLAWRDESPGVAYLESIEVDHEKQRVGIGAKLLEEALGEAKNLNLDCMLVRCPTKAVGALAFFRKQGFLELGAQDPDKVTAWLEEQRAAENGPKDGELILWAETRRVMP